ncbi:MAG: hypothetical protein NZ651_05855 [Candidatus Bipolaricaulota bacterium]|nr:hypothetical protein [Candidatus Bipolaricaulota bacterium]MDW8127278.1 hypothetical protein [Candidatus Bipolaricaulota bacterium]
MKAKVLVVYVSMWGATEKLLETAIGELSLAGLDLAVHDLARADLVDSRALVFGGPTVLGGLHPMAAFALALIRTLKPPLRFALILSSHGWAGGAVHYAQEALASLGAVDVHGQPDKEDIQTAKELAHKLVVRITS